MVTVKYCRVSQLMYLENLVLGQKLWTSFIFTLYVNRFDNRP